LVTVASTVSFACAKGSTSTLKLGNSGFVVDAPAGWRIDSHGDGDHWFTVHSSKFGRGFDVWLGKALPVPTLETEDKQFKALVQVLRCQDPKRAVTGKTSTGALYGQCEAEHTRGGKTTVDMTLLVQVTVDGIDTGCSIRGTPALDNDEAAVCKSLRKTGGSPAKTETAKQPEAQKRAETWKPPGSPRPPAPVANIDCGALLTADDLAKACKVKVEIKATLLEGLDTVCNRLFTETGKNSRGLFAVRRFDDAADVDNWLTSDKVNNQEAKFTDVSGLGDGAYTKVYEVKSPKSTESDLTVRKGNLVLHFVSEINKKPLCTLDQLQEVAKATLARLP
jgi:hypothetical protein